MCAKNNNIYTWREHAGHGVVGSSKLRRALKLAVLVRGFACQSTRSAAPA